MSNPTPSGEPSSANPKAFFEISIDGQVKGKLVFELFKDVVPKTADNFWHLCKGDKGKLDGHELTYKGSAFHRCIKRFMLQGGDFTAGNGTGGISIYGEKFEDENFHYKHDKPFLLSMANAGPGTNGSQFFITTVPTAHLDGKHVVFGRLISGKSLARAIEAIPTDSSDKPLQPVVISDCGALEPGEEIPADWLQGQGKVEGDTYEDYVEDEPTVDEAKLETLVKPAQTLKDLGAREFKAGNLENALTLFQKGLRYLDIHPIVPDDENDETKKSYETLRYSLLSNSALAALKTPKAQPQITVTCANRILSLPITISPADRSKTLYRRGLAHMQLKDLDAAEKDFRTALADTPGDAAIQAEIKKLNKIRQERKAKERQAYAKLFA